MVRPHSGHRVSESRLIVAQGPPTSPSACECREGLPARLQVIATTERLFLKDKQACFLILLIQNVSWELDFRVEYNYPFLSDLTLHSWEPNLVEKTKFCLVLPDVKSDGLFMKSAGNVHFLFSLSYTRSPCSPGEAPKTDNRATEPSAGSMAPPWGFLNIYNLTNSFAKLSEK